MAYLDYTVDHQNQNLFNLGVRIRKWKPVLTDFLSILHLQHAPPPAFTALMFAWTL
jgi:hypothetical protein